MTFSAPTKSVRKALFSSKKCRVSSGERCRKNRQSGIFSSIGRIGTVEPLQGQKFPLPVRKPPSAMIPPRQAKTMACIWIKLQRPLVLTAQRLMPKTSALQELGAMALISGIVQKCRSLVRMFRSTTTQKRIQCRQLLLRCQHVQFSNSGNVDIKA